MNSTTIIHNAHLNEWANRISDQQASGLSIREWCKQNRLSVNQFHYWKRSIKNACFDAALPDIVQIPVMSSVPQTAIQGHPIPLTSSSASFKIIANGFNLEIPVNASDDVILKLIQVVRYA